MQESPPKDLVRIFNQILGFQTPRLAEELWDLGWDILKKERDKIPHFFSPKPSIIEYQFGDEVYRIGYMKDIRKGYLTVCHLLPEIEEGLCLNRIRKIFPFAGFRELEGLVLKDWKKKEEKIVPFYL